MSGEVCRCGHGVAMHDLNRKGERTACWVIIGPKGVRCLCRMFWPQGHKLFTGHEPA